MLFHKSVCYHVSEKLPQALCPGSTAPARLRRLLWLPRGRAAPTPCPHSKYLQEWTLRLADDEINEDRAYELHAQASRIELERHELDEFVYDEPEAHVTALQNTSKPRHTAFSQSEYTCLGPC
jgi:hypothetical protein